MRKISENKSNRINIINNGYSQIGFLAQLELIKNKENDRLKAIALHELYTLKFGLKECRIKLSRIDEVNSTVKVGKRRIKSKRDENFIYF